MLASKWFETSTLPLHEKWYKFDYSMEKMTEVRVEELRTA